MLLRQGVRSLPVLDGAGHVQGLFSGGDALRIMLRPDDAIEAGTQSRLDDYIGPRRWHATARSGAVTVTGTSTDDSDGASPPP